MKAVDKGPKPRISREFQRAQLENERHIMKLFHSPFILSEIEGVYESPADDVRLYLPYLVGENLHHHFDLIDEKYPTDRVPMYWLLFFAAEVCFFCFLLCFMIFFYGET